MRRGFPGEELVGPGTGGVDDVSRGDGYDFPGQPVLGLDPCGPAAPVDNPQGLQVVHGGPAEAHALLDDFESQPGVVDDALVHELSRMELRELNVWLPFEDLWEGEVMGSPVIAEA